MGLIQFKKKKRVKDKEIGVFVASVLLESPAWDKAKFLQDLNDCWHIGAAETDDNGVKEEAPGILFADIEENMRLIVTLMPGPVPNGEAEHFAQANYLWPEAVETVKGHQAHLLVALMGENDLRDRAMAFVKAVDTCLEQEGVLAVYTDGAVFQPEFYHDFAAMMEEGELPLPDLVWFGLVRDGNQIGVYTFGLRKFGKEEMEVYVEEGRADFGELRDFLMNMAAYVIEENVVLNDGETIGYSAEQKLAITRSKGVALDGYTIKIEYGEG